MNTVLSYLPNVIAALLIFIVAAAIAGAVGGLVQRTMGDTPTGRVAALLTFLWVVIMRLCGLGEVGRGRRG
jgi:fucose permease